MAAINQLKQEFLLIESKFVLNLDNVDSVKRQVKQIIFVQKELSLFKKKVLAEVQNINQEARQNTATNRRQVEWDKKKKRDPYLKLQSKVDELMLEGDRLKLVAEEYYVNPAETKAKFEREQEEKRLAIEKNRLQNLRNRKIMLDSTLILISIAVISKLISVLFTKLSNESLATAFGMLTFVLTSIGLLTFISFCRTFAEE